MPFAILLPAAAMAGAALAIANARVDLERDRAAGLASVAIRLGPDRAWAMEAVLLLGMILVAFVSLWLTGAAVPAVAGTIGVSLVIVVGMGWGRGPEASPARRERAWEIEAIGVALLAAAWLAGIGDLR